jgi:hypothetical protein
VTADEPKDKEDEARRAEQLKILKRSAAQFSVFPEDDRKKPFKFHEEALQRFSNPVTGCKDGALYLWLDRGRPRAIVKVFTYDNVSIDHEFQSLSEGAIVAERDGKSVWTPTDPGVTYRELAGAPVPAETAPERLRQMKKLAGKFDATYTEGAKITPVDLRLLDRPVFRFEPGDDKRGLDGAAFVYVNGTNPMVLLLLEARPVGDSRKYYYAIARLGSGPVAARYDEKEVFSAKQYDWRRDPKQTFFSLPRQPVPKE